eukprot:gene3956-4581_t
MNVYMQLFGTDIRAEKGKTLPRGQQLPYIKLYYHLEVHLYVLIDVITAFSSVATPRPIPIPESFVKLRKSIVSMHSKSSYLLRLPCDQDLRQSLYLTEDGLGSSENKSVPKYTEFTLRNMLYDDTAKQSKHLHIVTSPPSTDYFFGTSFAPIQDILDIYASILIYKSIQFNICKDCQVPSHALYKCSYQYCINRIRDLHTLVYQELAIDRGVDVVFSVVDNVGKNIPLTNDHNLRLALGKKGVCKHVVVKTTEPEVQGLRLQMAQVEMGETLGEGGYGVVLFAETPSVAELAGKKMVLKRFKVRELHEDEDEVERDKETHMYAYVENPMDKRDVGILLERATMGTLSKKKYGSWDVRCKLSDFGISCKATKKHNLGHTGITYTPGYVAPEHDKYGAYNERVDIFCFGVVMFELITGHLFLDQFNKPEHNVNDFIWLPKPVRTVISLLTKDSSMRIESFVVVKEKLTTLLTDYKQDLWAPNTYRESLYFHATALKGDDVVIVAANRTPIGSMGGALSSVAGTKLQSISIADALKRANLKPSDVDEVIIGNVISSNLGQAPARQCAIGAGLPHNVVCTTVNKVCSSGMKAVMYGAQSILLGQAKTVVTGGFESMSNVPYYVDKMRYGSKYGNVQMIDGLVKDGLSDAYDNSAMGMCGEDCSKKFGFTRAEQDKYAVDCYNKTIESQKSGLFKDEIVEVSIPQRSGEPIVVREDEEPKKVKFDKIPTLKPAFVANGTLTAANSSKLNDGAATLILMAASHAKSLGIKPLAKIIGFADAEQAPIEFPTTPALAIPKALKLAGITTEQVDFFEINEAFSCVPMANAKILNIDASKLNVLGGAVALGHPIGSSGARIITTLTNILHKRNGKYGVAAICNGGGGASAIVIEKL